MTQHKNPVKPLMWFLTLLLAAFAAGCGGSGGGAGGGGGGSGPVTAAPGVPIVPGPAGGTGGTATDPTVRATSPIDGAINVPTSQSASSATLVTAIFSQPMDPATINSASAGALPTFTLKETNGASVAGTVAMNTANTVATFTPTALALNTNTSYTATVSIAAKNAGGTAMANPVAWSFRTRAVVSSGRLPVNLGSAGNFAILAKSGISTVPSSAITGDIGVSPISQTALTGFSETRDASNTFSRSPQVTGQIFASDYSPPTPTKMTTAVSDMETAFTDAAGRSLPNTTELGAGNIGGLTIAPGLHKWSSSVLIPANVTLSGAATDVWIFQIAQNLTQASGTRVLLAGALAKNVFWQVGGAVTIGTNAHLEGVVLSKTAIALATGATANSRLLAQTAVTLEQAVVTQPAP